LQTRFDRLEHVHLTDLTANQIRQRIFQREIATGRQIPVDAIALQLGVAMAARSRLRAVAVAVGPRRDILEAAEGARRTA
jgi:DNA-binding GntR family transcriptional regulator